MHSFRHFWFGSSLYSVMFSSSSVQFSSNSVYAIKPTKKARGTKTPSVTEMEKKNLGRNQAKSGYSSLR